MEYGKGRNCKVEVEKHGGMKDLSLDQKTEKTER